MCACMHNSRYQVASRARRGQENRFSNQFTVYNCQPLVWLQIEEVLDHWWCRYQVASRARRGQGNRFSLHYSLQLSITRSRRRSLMMSFLIFVLFIPFQLFHFIPSSSTSPYVIIIIIIIMTCYVLSVNIRLVQVVAVLLYLKRIRIKICQHC